jgi:hypothetical protein
MVQQYFLNLSGSGLNIHYASFLLLWVSENFYEIKISSYIEGNFKLLFYFLFLTKFLRQGLFETGSSPGCPQTGDSSASALGILGLQMHTTVPRFKLLFYFLVLFFFFCNSGVLHMVGKGIYSFELYFLDLTLAFPPPKSSCLFPSHLHSSLDPLNGI